MANEVGKIDFLDSDILNVIRDISFLKESYIKSCSDRKELEKQVDRLNRELRDAREAARIQITDLAESKQLITEQQITIAKLAAVKSDIKRYKEEIVTREKQINILEKEKIEYHKNIKVDQNNLEDELNKKINIMKHDHYEEVKHLQNELNILTNEMVCKARRLEEEKLQLCEEKDEMINRMVLEYEEKLQRAHAQYTCLKDETRSMVERYKNKIETLEQKNLPRTNVVQPNVFRNNIHKPCDGNTGSTATQFGRIQLASELMKQQASPGPYKLIQKGVTTPQSAFRPQPTQPMKPPPPVNEAKSLKRKLFTRNLDEFQESQ